MAANKEKGTRSIVGHHAGWGLTRSRTAIEPYRLTPGSIDTMQVRVREKIDIYGVGTDVIDMAGIFTVRRDHPCSIEGDEGPVWGDSCIKTEFRGLELVGQSEAFGTVRVHLAENRTSHGEVAPAEDGSIAADCVAHCYPAVELPELGLRLNTGDQAVQLASKVIQIPPVGDVARSANTAPLIDDLGNVLGQIVSSDIEVGEVLASFPLGSTGNGHSHDHAHGHTRHSHPEPSGPVFYANPPAEGAVDQHGHSPRPADFEHDSHEHQAKQSHVAQATDYAESGSESITIEELTDVLSGLESNLSALTQLVRKMVEPSGEM